MIKHANYFVYLTYNNISCLNISSLYIMWSIHCLLKQPALHCERAPDNPFIYNANNLGDRIPLCPTPFDMLKYSETAVPQLIHTSCI